MLPAEFRKSQIHPDKIQAADKQVISELKRLFEIAAEIQEQQSLLKTCQVMVKKFQSEIQNKDSEINKLQQMIEEASQKREKLKKNLKLRGLSIKEPNISGEQKGFFSIDLTTYLIISAVEASYKAIHDFSKPLINMMIVAKWDLNAAADSIEPSFVYAKRAHKKYAFQSYICQKMFLGFQHETFTENPEDVSMNRENLFHQQWRSQEILYLVLREMDPLDAMGQNPNSNFHQFYRSKYLVVIHPKMEASFFGNLDQRNYVFVKLAKSVRLLHRFAYSFDPTVKVFQDLTLDGSEQKLKVVLMVIPGF
ncbi:hypothetical protein RND81_13G107700 [Saponaria officinalis]|uniref:DUF641 domain-containing protein n=1 Tax=Saponaria officinalis TaxID=3572 RepID=A0AAW1H5P4_SAPOF